MAIISSKIFKFNFTTCKTKKFAAPDNRNNNNNICCHINTLPKELLGCIYQQLETTDCQDSFSLVCKSFHRIATNARSNAAWIVTRYGPRFAIYFAILSYPSKCTNQFIQYLINFGAQVPRYLIQVLIQVYGKPIDNLVKLSENRRRRSTFNTVDLDLFFLKAVQQLSFDGYACLINEGFKKYGKIDIHSNDLALFLSLVDNVFVSNDLIRNQTFFPAPLTTTNTNYKNVLKLAQVSPKLYDLIAPVFDFDPLARSSLWEAILLIFFDEAFRSTEPTQERQSQFDYIRTNIITHKGKHVRLVGPLTDQQIFCQAFATFFTKYPVGYCHEKTMNKLLRLLKAYVHPNFSIDIALKHMVQASIGRSDTIDSLDKFLKEKN
ncbi:hypothetical protein EDC94DRAFT_628969 [Helicostylum pulchrum]|nr:hypothetical protein EDC94DRAFT_628969 [Helicostylum pulchrum]